MRENIASTENQSLLAKVFTETVEFGNRYFTLGGYLFRRGGNVFMRIEMMMFALTLLCIVLLFWIHRFPYWVGLIVSLLLLQRIFEYLIVYSRNFILGRGRVFTHFQNKVVRGQWLILMFFLNMLQALFIFSIWYRFFSFHHPEAFSSILTTLDSLYFSIVTFFTIGYGDITPISTGAKMLVIFQTLFGFYTIVIVINGLISLHFRSEES